MLQNEQEIEEQELEEQAFLVDDSMQQNIEDLQINVNDYVFDLTKLIPTTEELSKYAEVVLNQRERIKGFYSEDYEALKTKFDLDCELLGIENGEHLLDSIINASIFYGIVDDEALYKGEEKPDE